MTTTTRTHLHDLAAHIGATIDAVEVLARQAAETEAAWYDEDTQTLSPECVDIIVDHCRQTYGTTDDELLLVLAATDDGTYTATIECPGFRIVDTAQPIDETSSACTDLAEADQPALEWARTLGYEWDGQRRTPDAHLIPIRLIRG